MEPAWCGLQPVMPINQMVEVGLAQSAEKPSHSPSASLITQTFRVLGPTFAGNHLSARTPLWLSKVLRQMGKKAIDPSRSNRSRVDKRHDIRIWQ